MFVLLLDSVVLGTLHVLLEPDEHCCCADIEHSQDDITDTPVARVCARKDASVPNGRQGRRRRCCPPHRRQTTCRLRPSAGPLALERHLLTDHCADRVPLHPTTCFYPLWKHSRYHSQAEPQRGNTSRGTLPGSTVEHPLPLWTTGTLSTSPSPAKCHTNEHCVRMGSNSAGYLNPAESSTV